MIAAVLARTASQREDSIERIARHVGAPTARATSGFVSVASWALAPTGRIEGSVALIGQLTRAPAQPGLEIAACGGDFAAAATVPDGLLLGRAALAGRPLFYWRDPTAGTVIACSRLAPLLGALDRRPDVDADRLASMAIAWPHFDLSSTPYAGVRRVELGHALLFSLDREPRARSHELGVRPLLEESAAEVALELRERLFAAVRRSIEGTRRVAVFCGGGVDSSGLLATAVAISRGATPSEVRAVTLHFEGPGDDRPYMRALCSALGIEPLRHEPREFGPNVRPTLVVDARPAAWGATASDVGLAQSARAGGAELVLHGGCGDELLDGDPRAFAQIAWQGDVLGALSAAHRQQVYWKTNSPGRIWSFVLRPLGARALPWLALASRRFRSDLEEDWIGPRLRAVVQRIEEGRRTG
jgi:asparagine synthetase B (glutamine-hydrolysing)